MQVTRDLPESMAEIINTLPIEELKKRIITENGLTVAQEEEILCLDPKDTVGSMTPQAYLAHLDHMIEEGQGED